MRVFKACCGCGNPEQDSQPYETARCAQSTFIPPIALPNSSPTKTGSPLHDAKAEDVVLTEADEVKTRSDKDRIRAAPTSSLLVSVGSTGQLFSILDAQSFNPPLSSTKIGESTPTKSLSCSALESGNMERNRKSEDAAQSLLTGEKNKGKFRSRLDRPLRRMTISSPLDREFSDSEFDHTKMVIPDYVPLARNENDGEELRRSGRFTIEKDRASCTFVTCRDGPVRMSCISTSTAYSRSNGQAQILEFAKALAENDRAYVKKVAKRNNSTIDVEVPENDAASKYEEDIFALSLTEGNVSIGVPLHKESFGDGYRVLDGSAEPLSPEESSQFYVRPPPNTPVDPAPKEELTTPATVKIRGDSAYYSSVKINFMIMSLATNYCSFSVHLFQFSHSSHFFEIITLPLSLNARCSNTTLFF
ncbi:hypothetical protein RB195_021724 [Necator americanus]|uniref:Uncharacterized protein n=1 Tax=Necator americanus TaxID=51031 RepID=A0ABR1ECM5_NECAM